MRRWNVLEVLAKRHSWKRGAEIGVWEGRTFFHLLDTCPDLTMIAVDAWPPAAPWGKNGERMNLVEAGEKFRAKADSPEYADRCIVLYGRSVDMAWDVNDASLDFVFIDADHSYEAVKADIAAWTPKVRTGGMVLGHDINWPSVGRAVVEAFGEYAAYKNNVWGVAIPSHKESLAA